MAESVRDWRLKKPGVHTHTETHTREALPAEVVARIEALEGLAQSVSDLSAQLGNLLQTFAVHIHDPPKELKELAQRVQALEALANRRAA